MRRVCFTVVPALFLLTGCYDGSRAYGGNPGDGSGTDTAVGTGAMGTSVSESGEDGGEDEDEDEGGEDEGGEDDGNPTELPDDLFLDGFFPIGVFGQPSENFSFWRDRGCNTMQEVPQGESAASWDEAAQALGLKVIRRPLSNAAADIGRTDLLAWSQPDEPDVEANNGPCGGSCVALCESQFNAWRGIDPDRKIFVNVAGPNVLLASSCDYCNGPGDEPPSPDCFPNNNECYPRIFAAADWVSQDIYPVTGWLPSETLRDDVTVVGQALDKIKGWTDKPLFAIIETSNQRLGFAETGNRGPSAAEYRAEVWNAILHGARGIFYFPQAFNPFEWDATPNAIFAEMELQHQLITELSPVLQGDIDPPDVGVVVPSPLQAGWRKGEGGIYVFVLNTSQSAAVGAPIGVDWGDGETSVDVYGESRSVTLSDGKLSDDFEPLGLHVYFVPDA